MVSAKTPRRLGGWSTIDHRGLPWQLLTVLVLAVGEITALLAVLGLRRATILSSATGIRSQPLRSDVPLIYLQIGLFLVLGEPLSRGP